MSHPRVPRVAISSTVDAVTASLREAILTGGIAPGDHLAERTLGSELGVSNIALREAFGRLAEEGLVVRLPRRGAFAAPISPSRVRDLTRARVLLEQDSIVLAMARWTKADDREAAGIVAAMRKAAKANDGEEMFQLDQKFHHVFWRASGSEILFEITMNLRGRIARSIREALLAAGDVSELGAIAAVHGIWLDAMRSGDESRAREEVARHIERAANSIIASLEARGIVDNFPSALTAAEGRSADQFARVASPIS